MLAWMIILTIALVAVIIFAIYASKEITSLRVELHKLLNFNPYAGISNGHTVYRSSVIKEVPNTYDSTPEFVKGITDMLEDIKILHKRLTYRNHYTGTGIDERSFELLEERVDNIADSVCGMENRIDELEDDIRNLKEKDNATE